MKKLFIISFLFVTTQFTLYAQIQDLSEEGYKHWIKAIVLLEEFRQESDYALIINEYLKVIETDPTYADVYYSMGKTYTKMGEIGGGLLCFNKAQKYYEKYLVLMPFERNTILNELTQLEAEIKKNMEYVKDMVFVKSGTFTMGCTNEQDKDCDNDEKPAHKVTISDFYIGKYPVTQAQWEAVMGSYSYPKGSWNTGCDDCPADNVNWNDIQEFIRKLNAQTGQNYRLPTEAEWEYAARGGDQSKSYKYSGSNNIDEVAWYSTNYKNSQHGERGTTHPVGTKNPNELGIYDMSGNVSEFCQDKYDKNYYSISPPTNPKGTNSGYIVLRGGNWSDDAKACRVTNRYSTGAMNFTTIKGGFRLTLSPFILFNTND
jgi:formylglycine-generating enzyme required for sulfatase activity